MNHDKEIVLNKGRVTFHTSAAIGQLTVALYQLRNLALNSTEDYSLLIQEYEGTIASLQSLDITGRKIMEIKQSYELKPKRRKTKSKLPPGQFTLSV